MEVLPKQEIELVAAYMRRAEEPVDKGGFKMPQGTTVRAAIALQRKWIEEQKVEKAKAEAKAAAEAAKRAAEQAQIEAERAKQDKAQKLKQEAEAAYHASKYKEAKALADEAVQLDPKNGAAGRLAALAAETLSHVVAGGWLLSSRENKMSDHVAVVVSLSAVDTMAGYGDPVRPELLARCRERELSLYVDAPVGFDADYGELYTATGRLRLDQDPAQKIAFGISDSRNALFFPNAKKWMATLAKRHSSVLLLEVPTLRRGIR